MKLHYATGALALALGLGIAACNSDTPTSPNASAKAPPAVQMDRSGPNSRAQSLSFPVAGPITDAGGATVANFAGTFSVTKFGYDQTTHQLTVTGLLTGVATYVDGTTPPANISQTATTTATLKKGGEVASTNSLYQMASASCRILLLDLGPLHLDVLGLVVDLNEVVLDITAQTGPNNLLGNLLCALTGILDIPGAIAGIINLIDSINNLLAGLGLASPVIGQAPFSGVHFAPSALALMRSA